MAPDDASMIPDRQWRSFDWKERIVIAATIVLCLFVNLGLGKILHWPVMAGYQASLLAGSGAAAALLLVVLAMLISVIVSTLIVGRLEFEAGLFTAATGLLALAVRGGMMGDLLRSASSSTIYATLMFETVFLGAIFAGAWMILLKARQLGWLPAEIPSTDLEDSSSTGNKLLSTTIAVGVSIVLMCLLTQSGEKKQVLWSVGIASLVGAMAAHQTVPARPSFFYWSAPLLTGIIGYAWALSSPGDWSIGIPANALAAASPLDYASAGTMGSILGYWVSRRWHATKEKAE